MEEERNESFQLDHTFYELIGLAGLRSNLLSELRHSRHILDANRIFPYQILALKLTGL